MKKEIVCPSCGAKNDENLPACPFCGTMIVQGAEKEYMKKLEGVKDDLEDLGSVPEEELKKSLKKQIIKVLIPIVIVLVLIAFGAMYLSREEQEQSDKLREEYVLSLELLPPLDALHDAGDFDKMFEGYYEIYCSENASIVYNWKHKDFCDAINYAMEAKLDWDYFMESGEERAEIYFFYDTWRLKYAQKHKKNYTEAEYAYLEGFMAEIYPRYDSHFELTEEQNASLEELITGDYVRITYTDCKEFLEKHPEVRK